MLHDTGGATAIEYAMVASLISIVIVASATSIGAQLKAFFSSVSDGLK
jgi:pilus assembly protein Flp/PilA